MMTEDRMTEIAALQQRVSMQGEHLHHQGTPWPEVVGRQNTAIWELFHEVRRLQEFEPKKGKHSK